MTVGIRRITAGAVCALVVVLGMALLRFDVQAQQFAASTSSSGEVPSAAAAAVVIPTTVVVPPPAPFLQAARAAALSGVPIGARRPSFMDRTPLYADTLGAYRAGVAKRAAAALHHRQVLAARRAAAKHARVLARQRARRAAARKERLAHMKRPSGGLVVGDSVALGAKSCLTPLGYTVDAVIGRQFTVGVQRLRTHAAHGLPATVVVHLGTNGPFSASDFESVMRLLGGQRRVVWVTIHLPGYGRYGFRDSLNQMIRDESEQYDNVRVADWARVSAEHPDWFAGDDIHLASGGCAGYTSVVDAAVTAPLAS